MIKSPGKHIMFCVRIDYFILSSECEWEIGIQSKMKMDVSELNRKAEWGCFDWQSFRKVKDVCTVMVRLLLLILYHYMRGFSAINP